MPTEPVSVGMNAAESHKKAMLIQVRPLKYTKPLSPDIPLSHL